MKNKKSQTATEYLINLAVVIIIAIIVVGAMGFFSQDVYCERNPDQCECVEWEYACILIDGKQKCGENVDKCLKYEKKTEEEKCYCDNVKFNSWGSRHAENITQIFDYIVEHTEQSDLLDCEEESIYYKTKEDEQGGIVINFYGNCYVPCGWAKDNCRVEEPTFNPETDICDEYGHEGSTIWERVYKPEECREIITFDNGEPICIVADFVGFQCTSWHKKEDCNKWGYGVCVDTHGYCIEDSETCRSCLDEQKKKCTPQHKKE